MNKKLTTLYIVMILVGLIMLFVMNSREPVQSQDTNSDVNSAPVPVVEKTESILVIRALRDLPAGSLLKESDYQAETIDIPVNSSEKITFALSYPNVTEYGIALAIKQNSLIPMASLVPPSSSDYIKMSLEEGMMVYPFSLIKTENYLLNNLNQGDLVDIYVSYGINSQNRGLNTEIELMSPSNKFVTTRMKPIIINRRVLLIDKTMPVANSNTGLTDYLDGSRLFVELSLSEVKLLKGLENNAKLFLFPSSSDSREQHNKSLILNGEEAIWPISTDEIFGLDSLDSLETKAKSEDIIELRGN